MHDYHDWHEAGNLWDCESANASWSSKVCKISENCARFGNCEAVCQNHPKSRFRSFTVRLFRPSWSRYCFWRSLFSSVSFSSSPSKAFKSFVPDFQSFKLNKMICWSFMKQIHLNLITSHINSMFGLKPQVESLGKHASSKERKWIESTLFTHLLDLLRKHIYVCAPFVDFPGCGRKNATVNLIIVVEKARLHEASLARRSQALVCNINMAKMLARPVNLVAFLIP